MTSWHGDLREIRRLDDGELCGFVRSRSGSFAALTVFYAPLAEFEDEGEAAQHVHVHGLASLHRRWRYRANLDDEWQTVLIQEARPGWVRLILGYYALAGVPTIELTVDPDRPPDLRPTE